MKQLNIAAATKRYNDLMYSLALEHNTIGERLSENTENWNLRDMVAECDYQYGLYFEDGNYACEDYNSEYEEVRKTARSDARKLKRFIEAYKPYISDLVCESGHCSKYDNNRR